jgi:hypothetical protein
MFKLDRIIKTKDDKFVFRCPGCNGIHSITKEIWDFNDDLEKPTIKPSILSKFTPKSEGMSPKVCHSYVTDGKIRFLNDSTHDLAGKTVDLFPVDGDHYNMELVEQFR